MIGFIIKRPIAVSMVLLSMLVLGIMAIGKIPVSLMPDIDAHEVSVQVYAKNTSARELENTVLKPLRRQLLQTSHMAGIKSESRDEHGIINLEFDYGTDIDFAFVEVNEKIDQALTFLPRSIERPRAIKASATDIPVFYLNITLKQDEVSKNGRDPKVITKFMELSRFSDQVIRKRLEQLPEVSLVDMSGRVYSEILIIPDVPKITALNITFADLEHVIKEHNFNLGNLLIRDGQYEYNVQVDTQINSIRDLEELKINRNGQVFKLSELAEIREQTRRRKGLVTLNGEEAISMAIIQQGDAQVRSLKKSLHNLVEIFKVDYPDIDFEVSQDQTALLDFSIASLQKSLIWGIALAFLVMFFFMKDFRSPFLIGVSIPVAVLMTILCFYICRITINIISLSGLILGIGMMIDNSIIVIDNIVQHREGGYDVFQSCIKGVAEVFRPLLSSVLTTCAVFVPLIFLSGISGALIFDQAMAVSIGLTISLAVSVSLLPVYYAVLYQQGKQFWLDRKLKAINTLNYEGMYEKGFQWVMRHQKETWIALFAVLAGGVWMFQSLPVSQMPPISRNDFILEVDWNEPINLDENRQRVTSLTNFFDLHVDQVVSLIGSQQYLLKHEGQSSSEVSIYIETRESKSYRELQEKLSNYLKSYYPQAIFTFKVSANIFDLIFSEKAAPLTARIQEQGDVWMVENQALRDFHKSISDMYSELVVSPLAWQNHLMFSVDSEKAILYNISLQEIIHTLRSAFNEREILLVTSGNEFVPILIGNGNFTVYEVINELFISNMEGKRYPLREVLDTRSVQDMKTIVADQDGVYYPFHFYVDDEKSEEIMDVIRDMLGVNEFRVDFTGALFRDKALIHEMSGVLLISVLLLYFILAAQFESVVLPLIILLEIPVDFGGAFLMLKIFGAGVNLMSMIGMVVMTGIIINDSILKIDTINQLRRKEGMPLIKALLVAGQRRIKPILMTTLTTILALLPVLFSQGMGADLQKPLALVMLGGMMLGLLVSLYFIPLGYYYLVKFSRVRNL